MNQVQIWAFDRFERIFILDVDILVLRELTKIIDETPLIYDIVGGTSGRSGCNGRSQLNGGTVLIKGSRYLHSVALQMLDDPKASCQSHRWASAEQELLNCLCGIHTVDSSVNIPGDRNSSVFSYRSSTTSYLEVIYLVMPESGYYD